MSSIINIPLTRSFPVGTWPCHAAGLIECDRNGTPSRGANHIGAWRACSREGFHVYLYTSHQPPHYLQRHHVRHTVKLGQLGRISLDTLSTPTFIFNNPQKWLEAAKVRADSMSRHRDYGRLTRAAGKTGGKTGGKGDSHAKPTKSHSAKAGLQVSRCLISRPRPRPFNPR